MRCWILNDSFEERGQVAVNLCMTRNVKVPENQDHQQKGFSEVSGIPFSFHQFDVARNKGLTHRLEGCKKFTKQEINGFKEKSTHLKDIFESSRK